MQKIDPQQQKDSSQDTWQIYQPKEQNESIFKVFDKQIKNLLKLITFLCSSYLILTLLSPLTIFVTCLFLITVVKLVKIKTKEIRKQGLINKISPKWRQILFQKSIFDIYSDILYFPLITKIIGAFVKPLIAKPHPQKLHHSFQQLPFKIQRTIARKGILSLAPQKIQQVVIDRQNTQKVPQIYGVETWEWKNFEKYMNHHQKVHEQTIVKKMVQRIDDKISWTGFMAMASIVAFGVYNMKPVRIKKMMIQNGSFVGILFIMLITIVKIKKRMDMAKQRRQYRQGIQVSKRAIIDKDE